MFGVLWRFWRIQILYSQILEFLGERGLELHPLVGAGMEKTEPPCVEHLSGISCRWFASIQSVAEERMPEMLKVDADLVGAPGVKNAFDQRAAAKFLQDAIFGFRGASARGFDDCHFFSMHGMPSDGRLDDSAFLFENPGAKREIDF